MLLLLLFICCVCVFFAFAAQLKIKTTFFLVPFYKLSLKTFIYIHIFCRSMTTMTAAAASSYADLVLILD